MYSPIDSIALYARSQPATTAAQDIVSGEVWSYRQLDHLVAQLATSLVKHGCVIGDRVVVLARNHVSLVALHFACARAGLIYVPLNWRLTSNELSTLIERTQPKIVLADIASSSLLDGVVDVLLLQDFVVASSSVGPREIQGVDRDVNRPSLILFTSGTSGLPKGVVLSEKNLLQIALNFAILTRVDHRSVFLCDAPMFHIIGLATNIRPVLHHGGKILISDGFEPERTLACLSDPGLNVSHYVGVPQMIESLRKQPAFSPVPLRRMIAIVTGGAPHSAGDIRQWLDDGITLVAGFGMSEAGTVFGMPAEPAVIRTKSGSVGVTTPSMEIRIKQVNGEDCAAGESGELFIRGDSVMREYWQDPEQTATAIDAQGWLATGDIVRCDEDGFFWIVDRKKDMFISGGENIYPAEIEALLVDYPGITEAALVGIPDPQWGEIGILVIIPDVSVAVNKEALQDFLSENLARYKLPKRVVEMKSLPRTTTGKIQKNILREQLIG